MHSRVVLTFALIGLFFGSLFGVGWISAETPTATPRTLDPLIVQGSQLSSFASVPITEVVLFVFDGSWRPVPFQIDERDSEGDHVMFEDGLIDANDELVFIVGDAGSAETSWPADNVARQHDRLRIEVDDALSQVSGFVYLFRSDTLPRSDTQYVMVDAANERISSISYTVGFNSAQFIGIDSLHLNGESADLVDRQKARASASVFGGTVTQNEEDFAGLFQPFTSIVTGPVRLIEGGDFATAFYPARFDVTVRLDIDFLNSQIPFGGTIQSIRLSVDHAPPASTGANQYFDSNGISATIDGSDDSLITADLRDWYQISGGALGGYVSMYPQLSIDSGTFSTYYADDVAPSDDTGDGQQFADTGMIVDSPSGILVAQQSVYVLPPNTNTAVGASYFQNQSNPLTGMVSAETFTLPTAIDLTVQSTGFSIIPAVVLGGVLILCCILTIKLVFTVRA